MLVPEDDKQLAVKKARQELKHRHWDFISYESKSTLIESRVREEGGEVWEAYKRSKKGEFFIKVFSDAFGAGDKSFIPVLPARISEEFMDKVMEHAGGKRLPTLQKLQGMKSADYLIGGFVFELKDLQEEVFEKKNHQKRLAELFRSYFPGQREVTIDPLILSKSDYLKYLDILCRPIKTQIRSASEQISSTKSLLGRSDLRGGIISLNTGCGSFQHKAFAAQVERLARKDSRQFDAVVSVSAWCNTNGFDTYVFSRFSPEKPKQEEVIAINAAFDICFEEMMTDLARSRIPDSTDRASPVKSLTFNYEGIDFAWLAPKAK